MEQDKQAIVKNLKSYQNMNQFKSQSEYFQQIEQPQYKIINQNIQFIIYFVLAFLIGVLLGSFLRCCSRRSLQQIQADKIVQAQDNYEKMHLKQDSLRSQMLIIQWRKILISHIWKIIIFLAFACVLLHFFLFTDLLNQILLKNKTINATILAVIAIILTGWQKILQTTLATKRQQQLTLSQRLNNADQILLQALPPKIKNLMKEALRLDVKKQNLESKISQQGCGLKCQLIIEKNIKDLARHEEVLRNLTTKFNWCDYCMDNTVNNNNNNNHEEVNSDVCNQDCGKRYIQFAIECAKEFEQRSGELKLIQKDIQDIRKKELAQLDKIKEDIERKVKIQKIQAQIDKNKNVSSAQDTYKKLKMLKKKE